MKHNAEKDTYDYIIVGAGAAGSVIAGELSKTGAEVLLIESGGSRFSAHDREPEHLVLQT